MLRRHKHVCHVFTDDPWCEKLIQDEFREDVQYWKVTMAPPKDDCHVGSSLRNTNLRAAVKDFWAMDCCKKLLGTKGSSVTTYVANVNDTFETQDDVGDYTVATTLTRDRCLGPP